MLAKNRPSGVVVCVGRGGGLRVRTLLSNRPRGRVVFCDPFAGERGKDLGCNPSPPPTQPNPTPLAYRAWETMCRTPGNRQLESAI
jgi:hypothetical protein